MDVLQKVRQEIDAIDDQLMELLDKRMQLALDVIDAKKKEEIDIYDPSRELEIYQKCETYTFDTSLKSIYREIMSQSKNIQKSRR